PCQSYSFELKLVDEHGSSTIDYNAVNVVTEASDLMSVSNLELDRVSLYSLYLKWFLPEESSACVSNYTVTFLTTDNNTMGTITPNKYITWTDVNFLSLIGNKRYNWVLLTSKSFVCVTNYKVIWYTPSSGAITSPLTNFNHSVSTGHLLPCTNYTGVIQLWNDRFRLQDITYTSETEPPASDTSFNTLNPKPELRPGCVNIVNDPSPSSGRALYF
ncbi:hypothetical protein J6590_106805, partial [Homalodisca vitripennis]